MKKYLCVQLKRLLRILLPILLITTVLFNCLMIAFNVINSLNEESEITSRFKIGIVGTAGDIYLQLGLSAMGSIDSSRYSLEMLEMQEQEAEEAMRNGTIAAYVVIPDGFLDSAFRGEFMPLKLVTAAGSVSIVSLVKEEFTVMIQTMLMESQKGIYGAGDAMNSQGLSGSKVITDISIAYAEFIFDRGNIYRTGTLEAFGGLGSGGYLASGLTVVFFMVICLTFAPVMIRRDQALSRMLCAQRKPISLQVLCDFLVYFLGLICIALVSLIFLMIWENTTISPMVLLYGLPIILAIGAMSFMLYELSSDFVVGVLLQFFITLVLCFICGCLYPITFFPDAVQALAAVLPVGLARMQIENCILGSFTPGIPIALLVYTAVFLGGAVSIRKIKATWITGVKQ